MEKEIPRPSDSFPEKFNGVWAAIFSTNSVEDLVEKRKIPGTPAENVNI